DMIESLELEEVLFAERPEELDLRAITGSHQLSEQKIEKLAQWKPVPIKNRSKSTSSLPRYARGLTMGISSPEESDYANTAKAVKGTFNKRRYHFKAICLMLLLSTAAYHAWSHVVHQPQVVTLMKQISTVIHTVI
ncbi:MAG: hypothetical protein K2Z81_22005, partial [Cyanobacteria bacterium]|nr:hypothetical protein [Cyanobacteriota bacterium]